MLRLLKNDILRLSMQSAIETNCPFGSSRIFFQNGGLREEDCVTGQKREDKTAKSAFSNVEYFCFVFVTALAIAYIMISFSSTKNNCRFEIYS